MLTKINNKDYTEKLNDEVIDGRIYKRRNYIVSEHLQKYRNPTKIVFNHDYLPKVQKELRGKSKEWLRFYDHVEDFRVVVPKSFPKMSLRCTFSSPYYPIEMLREHEIDPYLLDQFKFYIVNPKLYRFHVSGTTTFAQVENLDRTRQVRGTTNFWVKLINEGMIEETGEPLFYYF